MAHDESTGSGRDASGEPASTDGATTGGRDRRGYWVLMGYAVLFGVAGGLFSLVFMWILHVGESWYEYTSPGWMGGQWWWIALTAAAGVVVGLLRMLTRLPEKTPGLIADIQEANVEPRLIPGVLLVSAASLIGGASVGPEKALGTFGGGFGRWLATRTRLSDDDSAAATLSGMGGAYGGLFSSPLIVVVLFVEVVRAGGARFTKILMSTVLSSSISFGIYFAIAGAVFLGLYAVPAFEYQDWYLLAAVGMGLLSAVVSSVFGAIVTICGALFARIHLPSIVKSTIGGALFGLIGVMLPLTMMTGNDQLGVVLTQGSTLGLGLLIVLVIAKMVTMGVSLGSGFVGGPILPSLFVGGTAGVALHLALPGLPLGLTFACMLSSVVGGFVSAPFAMVLFAAFTTQMGALNTAPVLVSVVTSYLAVQAVVHLIAARREKRSTTAPT
ncbi:chloride channel protein [Microbacterium rhizosphaerae]|uniref:Chloride channel protein n=1 Tax=Microbacterium rhizosphaerae TaxID=1678237 RepID=A0ABZ0SNT8_9MICO|nr:chloride channel protein [Microbacterium rhizosphaerae]WPR90150.1 chloride channel protein [Microbacterium rhizosphaerae]